MNTFQIVHLGRTDYLPVWELQKKLFYLRSGGAVPDVMILTEHNHVYTLGKKGDESHFLSDKDGLRSVGADLFRVDRGGGVTYHGPGQIVGYPVIDLKSYYLDIHRYLRDLEEVLIRTLGDFGIDGRRERDYTGVWAGSDKIAAIGVKVSRWITMHGFALNVNTEMAYFDRIIPCGIFHAGVTSMQRILGINIPVDGVCGSIETHFGRVFGTDVVEVEKNAFMESINESKFQSVKCA